MRKGFGTRFDELTPNQIDRERDKSSSTYYLSFDHVHQNVSFCEGCKSLKPKPKKLVKGWRCKECLERTK